MVDVKNRWALITGAARGIGYLTAKRKRSLTVRIDEELTNRPVYTYDRFIGYYI